MIASTLTLGVPVDDVTMDEAADEICRFVAEGRRTGRSHQVATVNADFVVNASGDADDLAVLQRADLCIPDGMPLVWGSRLLGSRLRQRVTGVDLVPALAERAARLGYTIYLFGGSPGTAEVAAARLRERYPGAEIIGDTGPVFARPEDMDPEALERIRSARPDIICVALGNPKQERWIDCYRDVLGASVLIGVGGTLDILVGEKRRAPQWTQRIGMEWVYRAAQEPRRLGPRYLQDIRTFVPGFARQAWSLRPRGAGGWRPAEIEVDGAEIVVRPRRRLLMADVSPVMAHLALRRIERIVVDLSGVPFVDNASASALATLARQASRSGAGVVLTGVGARAERCLERHRIAGWLDAEPERQLDAVGTLAG